MLSTLEDEDWRTNSHVLGTRRAATPDEVKKAFHKRARQVHPDKNNAPGATQAMRAVKAAYGPCADYAQHRATRGHGPSALAIQIGMIVLAGVLFCIFFVFRQRPQG
jgi:DnaJ domain